MVAAVVRAAAAASAAARATPARAPRPRARVSHETGAAAAPPGSAGSRGAGRGAAGAAAAPPGSAGSPAAGRGPASARRARECERRTCAARGAGRAPAAAPSPRRTTSSSSGAHPIGRYSSFPVGDETEIIPRQKPQSKHCLKIQDKYLNYIKCGKKTIEGRLNSGKTRLIKAGEYVDLDSGKDRVTVMVKSMIN